MNDKKCNGLWGNAYAELRRRELEEEKNNFNLLTNAETERLGILAEEMAECIQVVGKILRHGYESRNPLVEDSLTNRQHLEIEIGDVEHIIYRMACARDVDRNRIDPRRIEKGVSIVKWLHHQDD